MPQNYICVLNISELEEEEGPVLDFLDDLIDNVMVSQILKMFVTLFMSVNCYVF